MQLRLLRRIAFAAITRCETPAFSVRSCHVTDEQVCQEQWMLLNPTIEEDELYEEEELSEPMEPQRIEQRQDELRSASLPNDGTSAWNDEAADASTRLELSLTEDDLDSLLNSLPADQASAKETTAFSSEMQWVLSFLNDPIGIAQYDAEAKNLLGSQMKSQDEDDNYQFFLQELEKVQQQIEESEETSVVSTMETTEPEPEVPKPAEVIEKQAAETKSSIMMSLASRIEEAMHLSAPFQHEESDEDEEEEEESDDEEWERTRRSIKGQPTSDTSASKSSKTSSKPKQQSMTIPYPPARGYDIRLPVALPPPAPRMEATISMTQTKATTDNHTKRLTLCHEITAMLQAHGEFQFPRHLFPHHNDNTNNQADEVEDIPRIR